MIKISELFTLEYGHSLELNRLTQTSSATAINFVSRTAKNNGVSAKVQLIESLEPACAGTITVALNGQGGAGVAFLQPFPYYTGYHVMVLAPKIEMSDQEKLWWTMCITANRFRFGFGRQANRTLKDLTLPDPKLMPDWVTSANTKQFDGCVASAKNNKTPVIDARTWKAFRYDEIFEIRKGYYNKKPPHNKIGEGIPFIGATENKNGITGYVTKENIIKYARDGKISDNDPIERKLFPAGSVTVSNNGSVGEAFYQPVPFTCSHDVNPLYLKNKSQKITPAIGLFLSAVIRADKYRWGYGRKWRPIRMPDSIIDLPVDKSGSPDWKYMESYIKTLPYSSQISIHAS